MAPFNTHELVDRIRDIVVAKWTIYKDMINSDIPALTTDLVHLSPIDRKPQRMSMSIFALDDEPTDEPQETGYTMVMRFRMMIFFVAARFTDLEALKVHGASDTMRLLINSEKNALDPTSGLKLAWLWRIEPLSGSVDWIGYTDGQGGLITVTRDVKATIDVNASF